MYRRTLVALSLLLLLCGPVFGAQLITNGEFDADLNGWTSNGSVIATSGFALIQEAQQGETSALFQSIGGRPALLLLKFEISLNGMSLVVASGGLADTAFGTLYFGDAPFGNNVSGGVFMEEQELFDLDRNGLRPAGGVTVESLPNRPGWASLSVPFSTSRSFVTFVMEEIDLNLTPGDSALAFDNVSVTVIPEPSSPLFLLFAIGLSLARRTRPT